MTRLSSGLRINSAVDDAAGPAIVEGMRAQILGARQAQQNIQDGVNLLRVADSALSESMGALHRVRVIAVQGANGIYDDRQRSALQELQVRTIEALDDIARRTQYNSMRLLDGSRSTWAFQVGAGGTDSMLVSLAGSTAADLGLDAATRRSSVSTPDAPGDVGAYISVLTAGDAGEAIDRVDAAMHLLTQTRTGVGVAENALIRLMNYLDVRQLNRTAAQGRIRDADVAAESSKLTLLQAASEASARALNLSIPSQFEAVSVLLAGIPTPPSSSTAAAAAVVSSRPKRRGDRLYKSPQRATPPRPRRRSRGSRRRGRLAAQRGDAVEEVAARSTQVFLPADSRRPADGARLSGMEILSLSQVPDAVDHLVAESLVETPTSTLRVIRLAPGQTLPPHTHASSDLVMLVVEGRATLDTPDGPRQLDPGNIAVLVGSEELRVGNEGQDNVTLAAFLSPPFPPRS